MNCSNVEPCGSNGLSTFKPGTHQNIAISTQAINILNPPPPREVTAAGHMNSDNSDVRVTKFPSIPTPDYELSSGSSGSPTDTSLSSSATNQGGAKHFLPKNQRIRKYVITMITFLNNFIKITIQ